VVKLVEIEDREKTLLSKLLWAESRATADGRRDAEADGTGGGGARLGLGGTTADEERRDLEVREVSECL
jgi:hypothetical protein